MTTVKSLRKPLIALVVLIALTLFIWLLLCFFKSVQNGNAPAKKQVQKITVLQPPPPPPPKPKEEEPQPKEEEVKVEEDQPPEDVPEDIANDTPQGEQLGLDSEGVAGDNGFGLIAKKGGRGLLDGGGPFAWYKSAIKQEIFDAINQEEELRRKSYQVKFRIWLNTNGTVKDVDIASSSGDEKMDRLLQKVIKSMASVKKIPPLEMPQPIILQLVSRL